MGDTRATRVTWRWRGSDVDAGEAGGARLRWKLANDGGSTAAGATGR